MSARWIDVALQDHDKLHRRRFKNDQAGHQALCAWLTRAKRSARIVLEASGIYSLDLALALDAHAQIEVMVANPRTVHDYAKARMQRSKTDKADAQLLCDYAQRMPFVPWDRPDRAVLELRQLARRLAQLVEERTRERNRLHAAQASKASSRLLINDIEVNIRHLERRLKLLLEQALALIEEHAELSRAYAHLVSVRGIAARSAVQMLPELWMLPEDMSVRQWVAHAGLDVAHHESGSSVQQKPHISRQGNVHLRRALYMPALVAIRWEPHVQAFYEKLIAKGKKPLVAIVAVMRKLLHSIYGMLKHDEDFDGEKFYRMEPVAA